MAGIFTRKAIAAILNDEALTPEERTDQLFSLYGRALDDGYITKSAAQAATNAAVETAKAEAAKDFQIPDARESDAYKELQGKFDAYKQRQEARLSPDYAEVKPKFFDAVYDRIDRADGAKSVKEQLDAMRGEFEEYFNTPAQEQKATQPQFGEQAEGSMPTGSGEGSFAKAWGYDKFTQKG